jgi:hypothetical protein
MASDDKVMTSKDFGKGTPELEEELAAGKIATTADAGKGKAARATAEPLEGTAPYTATQTVAINNRGVVMYLEEGQPVDLFQNEADVLIGMGYVAAPEPPPIEGRKGAKAQPETPESKTPKAETR